MVIKFSVIIFNQLLSSAGPIYGFYFFNNNVTEAIDLKCIYKWKKIAFTTIKICYLKKHERAQKHTHAHALARRKNPWNFHRTKYDRVLKFIFKLSDEYKYNSWNLMKYGLCVRNKY